MDLNFGNNNQSLTGMNEYIPSSLGGSTDSGSTGNSGSYYDLANFGKAKANPFGFMSAGGGTGGKGSWMDGLDSLKLFGAASQGLTGLGALLQAYNGYKQLQLGRDTFDFQKGSYNQDSSNQARLVNSELQDRQAARISSTGNNNALGAYEGLDSYMNKNRVSVSQL
jgi:hypothetical protein